MRALVYHGMCPGDRVLVSCIGLTVPEITDWRWPY
jgi:hypothetical protein